MTTSVPHDPTAVERLARTLESGGLAVERDRDLAPWTTLKVGGPAAVLVEATDAVALDVVLRALGSSAPQEVPFLVLGRGSNMLLSDDGFPGLVLRLGTGFRGIRRDGLRVTAGGAEPMPALAAWTGTQGLSGLEFAAGVPASVGGSVRMNAGAHGGDVAQHLVAVEVAPAGAGAARAVIDREALGLGYRQSSLPPRSVVVGATWELTEDDPASVRARLDAVREQRRRSQPIGERTCGSVFTNPPGDSAGRWVESAGLKGTRVGGARVSPMHANFIETEPGARATDVLRLIRTIQSAVVEAGGPLLEPEVRVIGFRDDAAGASPSPSERTPADCTHSD